MTPHLESFGITDIGLMRSNNEDVWAAVREKNFFILADGMGGHKAGEVASSFTLKSMCESITELEEGWRIEEVCRLLRTSIAKANQIVFDAAHQHHDYTGMGTTLSCFVITEDHLVYGHIGDSRVYRLREREPLRQLTIDHCLSQGVQSPNEQAPVMRNVITRAIGTLPSILPDIGVIPLQPNDIYMICSDGLSDYVNESTIAELLSSQLSLEDMGKKLIEAALAKGGNDNITLLLVRVCAP